MECDTLTSSLTVPSEDNPSKPIKKSQMTAPDTETQDQEPMTIIVESMEPDMKEIETLEPDKTKDHLKIPTNSKPTSGIPQLIKPKLIKQMTSRLKIASINIGGIRDGNLNIVGLQEVAFHSCPIIESCYHLLANVGPNKNGTAILIRHVTTRLPFVLMGDFNRVDDIQDRANIPPLPVPCSVVSYASKEMVTGLDLVDIWKKLNNGEPGHTFHYHSDCRTYRVELRSLADTTAPDVTTSPWGFNNRDNIYHLRPSAVEVCPIVPLNTSILDCRRPYSPLPSREEDRYLKAESNMGACGTDVDFGSGLNTEP
ncbi:hypothetical protein OUZ56_024273 [Daphnia magna]|uniref:Endonuclease/exonuclease/phosphatase domain-containing protein n=1 Tax=Daphnia magna TaxID=35525 RepID=A0ABR0B156_9CRUS|nr:hypothetical protein OUZ56_024273 [Daphnia magna]